MQHKEEQTSPPGETYKKPLSQSNFAGPPSNAINATTDTSSLLLEYIKELVPMWEKSLCDAEANAVIPDVEDAGIGVEIGIDRPDPDHPDVRRVFVRRSHMNIAHCHLAPFAQQNGFLCANAHVLVCPSLLYCFLDLDDKTLNETRH